MAQAMNELFQRPRTELRPGAVHVPGWLDLTEQQKLVNACRQWAKPPAGMRAVFGGASRMAYHGVPKTLPGTGNPELGLGDGRLNITLRESGLDA